MQRKLAILTIATLTVLGSLPPALAWGGFDPVSEPSTKHDTPDKMFQTSTAAPQDRIYLDAQLQWNFAAVLSVDVQPNLPGGSIYPLAIAQPVVALGYWRDCNGDGYIGDSASGLYLYPVNLANDAICPEGSAYNPGNGWVDEWRAIGPNANDPNPDLLGFSFDVYDVADGDARVWGDWRLPTEPAPAVQGIVPLPPGTLQDTNGHLRYVDDATGDHAARRLWNENLVLLGDWENKPNAASPLGVVKRLYNDSDRSDGRATPLATVWNCDKPNEGPGGITPGIEPGAEPSGSIDGFYSQFTRTVLPDPVSGDPGGYCVDDGGHLPYGNLETQSQESREGIKTQSDQSFGFVREVRSQILPTGENFGDPTGACWRRGTPTCTSTQGGFWIGGETWSRRPPRALWGPVERLYHTVYANVGPEAFEGAGASAASALPGGMDDRFVYGSEQCDGLTPIGAQLWECNPALWTQNRAVVGDVYDLRDIDCYDNSISKDNAPGTRAGIASACE